jgi:hypothetical protein
LGINPGFDPAAAEVTISDMINNPGPIGFTYNLSRRREAPGYGAGIIATKNDTFVTSKNGAGLATIAPL